MSIADYYRSRYRKIAQAMREIDRVGDTINQTLCTLEWFKKAKPLVNDYILIARNESEILRGDPDYLTIVEARRLVKRASSGHARANLVRRRRKQLEADFLGDWDVDTEDARTAWKGLDELARRSVIGLYALSSDMPEGAAVCDAARSPTTGRRARC